MKRKISIFLALILLFGLLAVSASAAEDPVELARQEILKGYERGSKSVDLSYYNLSSTQLKQLYEELYYGNQLPWYAYNYEYEYVKLTDKILQFKPILLDEETYDRALYERKVAEVLAETVHPGMSELQIALSVHDYLAANSCYDESKTYYEGYDLLVRGTAVCSGYAEAYMDILKRAGVECTYVISEAMDHGWNLVKIEGQWYHVDVTWDDPVQDRQGRVQHTFFLLSDEQIQSLEKPHYSWEALSVCTDKTYDGEDLWDKSLSQICYESADVRYYHAFDGENHTICREEQGSVQVLYTYDNQAKIPIENGNRVFKYETCGLSLMDGRLYFCNADTVYSIKTDGTDLRHEHKETFSERHGILSCYQREGVLKVTTWDLKDTYTHQQLQLEGVELHSHQYQEKLIPGDCAHAAVYEYTCQCGITYQIPGEPATGHSYETVERKWPGLLDGGEQTKVCSQCGDTVTQPLSGILSKERWTDRKTWVQVIVAIFVIRLITRIFRKKKK